MPDRPFNVVKSDGLLPLLPHCGNELPEVHVRIKGLGFLERRDIVCFCPHCSKVLGFGQGRMM